MKKTPKFDFREFGPEIQLEHGDFNVSADGFPWEYVDKIDKRLEEMLEEPIAAHGTLQYWAVSAELFMERLYRLSRGETDRVNVHEEHIYDFMRVGHELAVYGDELGIAVPNIGRLTMLLLLYNYADDEKNPDDEQRRNDLSAANIARLESTAAETTSEVFRLQFQIARRAKKQAQLRYEVKGGKLTSAEKDLVEVVSEAGHRMRQKEIFDAMSKAEKLPSEGTTKIYLARLVREGILTMDRHADPPGYGLPEWDK